MRIYMRSSPRLALLMDSRVRSLSLSFCICNCNRPLKYTQPVVLECIIAINDN